MQMKGRMPEGVSLVIRSAKALQDSYALKVQPMRRRGPLPERYRR
jgi:hypothetical protein